MVRDRRRFGAALVGTLSTWLVYRLAADWFDRLTGLLAAWLWAITLWPVHLSRVGFRAVLLVPALTVALWLATRAYRRPAPARWLLAGFAYGLTVYTYLAARFTPVSPSAPAVTSQARKVIAAAIVPW